MHYATHTSSDCVDWSDVSGTLKMKVVSKNYSDKFSEDIGEKESNFVSTQKICGVSKKFREKFKISNKFLTEYPSSQVLGWFLNCS